MSGDGSEFFSDRALALQAAASVKRTNGEKLTWADMAGIYERRIPPTEAERCNCCGSDARGDMGGEIHHGVRWCDTCIGREHHEDLNDDGLGRIAALAAVPVPTEKTP